MYNYFLKGELKPELVPIHCQCTGFLYCFINNNELFESHRVIVCDLSFSLNSGFDYTVTGLLNV